jgi:hypothetical protein
MVCAPCLAQRSGIADAGQTLIFQRLGVFSAISAILQNSKYALAYETALQGGMS